MAENSIEENNLLFNAYFVYCCGVISAADVTIVQSYL